MVSVTVLHEMSVQHNLFSALYFCIYA